MDLIPRSVKHSTSWARLTPPLHQKRWWAVNQVIVKVKGCRCGEGGGLWTQFVRELVNWLGVWIALVGFSHSRAGVPPKLSYFTWNLCLRVNPNKIKSHPPHHFYLREEYELKWAIYKRTSLYHKKGGQVQKSPNLAYLIRSE